MSRQIKFRAWFNRENKMVPADRLEFQYSKEDGAYVAFDCDDLDESGDYVNGSYSFELMQYTGCHDKNDQEIYEGDIIYYTVFERSGLDKQYKGVVKWSNDYAGWCLASGDGSYYQGPMWWVLEQDDEPEVIGNIYENPELLKEGEV